VQNVSAGAVITAIVVVSVSVAADVAVMPVVLVMCGSGGMEALVVV
jgi:hypothetical protein